MAKSPTPNAGNINMKGKKHVLLGCRCCECIDLRQKELDKVHAKEMRDER